MNNEIIIFHRPNIPPERYEEPIHINFSINSIICAIKVQKSRLKIESNMEKEPDKFISLKLPKCDGVPKWREAISDISKYLMPYTIGDIKKMNSKILTYKIRVDEFIPLYYIAKEMNLNNLCRYMEISIDSGQYSSDQIAHLYLDCKDKLRQISFPEIISHFELILETSPPSEVYLTSLQFASIILCLQKQKQSREFIRKWLHTVFKEFDKTKQYFNQMFQIVSNHQIINESDAFIVWVYSQYFPSINSNKRFSAILSNYELTEDDMIIPLTENQAVWFFENRTNKESLTPRLVKLIVPYAYALYKTDPSKCSQLFHDLMISINSNSNVKDDLSLDELINLLFLAAHPPSSGDAPFYQSAYDTISNEIQEKVKFTQNNNEYIFGNIKEIMKLSWEQLFSTFNFCANDIFIEICYKWLKKNQKFGEDELNQFYSLFPLTEKKQFWKVRYSYILFRIFDLLNQQFRFNLVSIIDPAQLFEGKGSSSIENLFSYILEKTKVFIISPETLKIIHEKVKLTKKEQILLVTIIKFFKIEDFDLQILLPIFEESIDDVISILATQQNTEQKHDSKIKEFEDKFALDTILNSARKYFGKIKISSIVLLPQLFSFNSFFDQKDDGNFQPIEVMNEDRVALYASLSNEFDPQLIDFSQLSFRLISSYCEAYKFQFATSENSPVILINKNFTNSPSMVNAKIDIKTEWMKVSIPRFHFHEIGMITVCVMTSENQRTTELLKRSFEFIGIQHVNIIFPSDGSTASIPEDNPIIVIKPLENSIDCPLESMIRSFLSRNQPVAMNCNSCLSLLKESPEFANLSGLINFESDFMDEIEWSEPSPEFLPFKENLPILNFKSIDTNSDFYDIGDYNPNADVYFHSISCKLIKNLPKKVTFSNGRLFAAKIHPTFSLFNYDIFVDGDEQSPFYWACFKQMALTTLSLFFDFRLKYCDDGS